PAPGLGQAARVVAEEVMDVTAGAEGGARPGEDEHARQGIVGDLLAGGEQGLEHRVRERVAAVGPVEPDRGDRAPILDNDPLPRRHHRPLRIPRPGGRCKPSGAGSLDARGASRGPRFAPGYFLDAFPGTPPPGRLVVI